MANFIGQSINIPDIGQATVTGLYQYTNTPGFDVITDKGTFLYYDSSYVNQGLVNGGSQWISPDLLGYIQNKQTVSMDLSSYSDIYKSTKSGIPISGNGYFFTNPAADNVNPWIVPIDNNTNPINGIKADASGNLSYQGYGPYNNGSYTTTLTNDGNGYALHTDRQWTTYSGGGGFFGGLVGGIGSFINSAFNSVSDFFGTSGGGGGVLGALASIDPGPALGAAAATVDKAVTDTIPGGWATVAAVAATIASAGTASPALVAEVGGEAAAAGTGAAAAGTGTAAAGAGAIATEAGQTAFFDALANGATSAQAVDAGLAAQTAATAATGAATANIATEALPATADATTTALPATADATTTALPATADATTGAGTTSAELTSGSITAPSSYVSPSQALTADVSGATTGAGTGMTYGSTGAVDGLVAPTSSAIAVDPAIAAASGAELPTAGTTATGAAMGAGTSGVGSLSPALPAAGATETGTMSAALAPNTVLGTGAPAGGAIGASYQLGADGLPATNAIGTPISGSSVGIGGSTATPISFSSSDLANLLKSSAASGATSALQKIATSNSGSAIPALIRGNQNPFMQQTAQQPIRNTSPELTALANLLKQG